jgi:phosphoglycerate dehydrogenase-like enzyme
VRQIFLTSHGGRFAEGELGVLREAGFELVEAFELDNERDARTLARGLNGAWGVIAGSESYSREALLGIPDLRVIARFGAGYDRVDVEAATELGVAVVVQPAGNAASVADFTLALILGCLREIPMLDGTVRGGCWRPARLGRDLTGATVAIVGLGAIGRAVAQRLAGFECRLLAVDVAPDREYCARHGIEVVELDDAVRQADVVTLHVPGGTSTRHLISARELALMKPGAILVNTSRGNVVDEAALADAVRSGRLGGAALDVFEREPLPADHELLALPGILVSGHFAMFTRQAVRALMEQVVAGILAVADGLAPPGCVNPEAISVGRGTSARAAEPSAR